MPSKLPLTDRLAAEMLHWFPKQAFSRAVGWASRLRVPMALRVPLYRGFAWCCGVDLSELDRPLVEFERFDDFFCRPLPPGARTIAAGEDVLVSPCDGLLCDHGLTEDGYCLQAKGIRYSLYGLLADEDAARRLLGGSYATLYLAPHNYHRVHAPSSGLITGYRHIPGARYPVNALSVRTIPQVFLRNERVVTYLQTPLGFMALVMVAATGVGHITLRYEPSLATPAGGLDRGAACYEPGKPITKGDELGIFHLGSTVILLFEPGRVKIQVPSGSLVRLGQALGQGISAKLGPQI
ncbi:MAG: archaetidylserine decarboxylase [Myxococcales bacterium]|nr:archaetidylserine decarboxylase [Myxococcota bacterium]MDW8283867.1 archaetidylserine decarboxylase [Myxococcales bacterium]